MNGQLVKQHNVIRGSRVTGRSRAMPETEKPPAKPVDIYFQLHFTIAPLLQMGGK